MDQNKEIQKFMKKEGIENNHELQTYFNIKLQKILSKYGKKLMGWDEIMTKNMPKTAVIHSWRGVNEGFEKGTLIKAVKEGYNAVLSNDYYIDRMQSVNHHYLYDPTGGESLTSEEKKRVLGGEVTMWSELVTPLTIDSRIWPRTAAIAERFWSPEEVIDIASMRIRLEPISMQLEEFGITHYRNRDVILRNIAKSGDISSLLLLTKIYEPLKIYTRNKGGTEYQTFSPFTLFADACSSDASDAYLFNKLAETFTTAPNKETKEKLLQYFNAWINGYQNFSAIPQNPIVSNITEHYKTLEQLSLLYVEMLSKGTISTKNVQQVEAYLDVLKEPLVDTELVIVPGLERLIAKAK
nr:family 20 glycosylhydrolase [Tenacibaculum sp. SG-28]